MRLLLLTGMPATGKTFLGNWLEREHGFVHLDVEKDGVLERAGLSAEWAAIFEQGTARAFAEASRRRGQSVVVNWGFPPHCLPQVRLLKKEGFEMWWLDADPHAARRAFLRRGTGSVADFDRQVASIASTRDAINRIVAPRVIEALAPDGRHLAPADIFVRMTRRRRT